MPFVSSYENNPLQLSILAVRGHVQVQVCFFSQGRGSRSRRGLFSGSQQSFPIINVERDLPPITPVAYAWSDPGKPIALLRSFIVVVTAINMAEKIQCKIKPPSGVLYADSIDHNLDHGKALLLPIACFTASC